MCGHWSEMSEDVGTCTNCYKAEKLIEKNLKENKTAMEILENLLEAGWDYVGKLDL
jgi:methanogenic corrinoid protein MtbC1